MVPGIKTIGKISRYSEVNSFANCHTKAYTGQVVIAKRRLTDMTGDNITFFSILPRKIILSVSQ